MNRGDIVNGLDQMARVRLLRRTFLAGAAAVGAGASLGTMSLLSNRGAEAATGETIQEILDITVTTEMFGVTILGLGLDAVEKGNIHMAPAEIAIVKAARGQEQAHLDFFLSLGGRPLTQTFYVPDPKILQDKVTFFQTVEGQEAREVAAQLAAFATFVEMQRPDLVKVSFQYAAEEAEHRLLANYAAGNNFATGNRPPNNYAFAPMLYGSVKEYLADITRIGVINGSGPGVNYPGPGAIDYTNVTERVPSGRPVAGAPSAPAAPPMQPPAGPVASPTPRTFLGVTIPPGFG